MIKFYKSLFYLFILFCFLYPFQINSAEKHKHLLNEDCDCGPTRWDTIKEGVFNSAILKGPDSQPDKYYPEKTLDENTSTAWCVRGEDIPGANIRYQLGDLQISDETCGIEILPGLAKNNNLFKLNSRPKKILLELLTFNPNSTNKSFLDNDNDYITVYKKELIFKDEMKYQKFFFDGNLDKISKEFNKKNNLKKGIAFLKLTILEVYKGSKWEDTCISEIHFLDKDGRVMRVLPDMK